MNLVRQDPAGYAFHLEDMKSAYQGRERRLSTNQFLETQEGVPAVDEAIHVLQTTTPRRRLEWDDCLAQSAQEHVDDTGPAGLIGHDSSRGESSSHRIRRYLPRFRMIGENISYGSDSADEVVRQLLIDDGVPDRGHRKNIFEPHFNRAGVACGPHAKYGVLCVIDFAQD